MAHGGSGQLSPRDATSCCTKDLAGWDTPHSVEPAEDGGCTASLARPYTGRRRLPEGSVTFLDQDRKSLQIDQPRPVIRGCRKPDGGPGGSGGLQGALPCELPAHGPSDAQPYCQVSASADDSDDCGWSTEISTDSGNEASVSMQLSMLYEATRWFPHTNFYAEMKARAKPEVDKKQAHRDAGGW